MYTHEEIKKMLTEISSFPWVWKRKYSLGEYFALMDASGDSNGFVLRDDGSRYGDSSIPDIYHDEPNAVFIAAAPSIVQQLLDEIDRLKKE